MALDEDRAWKQLWKPVFLTNAADGVQLFLLVADRLVIVRDIVMTNVSGSTQVIDFWFRPGDGAGGTLAATDEFKFIRTHTLDAGGWPISVPFKQLTLEVEGDAIFGKAAGASVVSCQGHGIIESTA